MFDKAYLRAISRSVPIVDTNYNPNDAVTYRRHLNPDTERLVVIFPHWHGGGKPYEILARRFVKKGWSVLLYNFHDQILSAEDEKVEKSFDVIKQSVTRDLRELRQKHSYKTIHFSGISLGNVPLTMVAGEFRDFDSATLVVPGDNLALDMWHSMATQNIKKVLVNKHVNLKKLEKEWIKETPGDYVAYFAGKPVRICVSLADKVIRTPYQKHMIKIMSEAGARETVAIWRIGHVLSIARYCLIDRLP